MLVVHVLQNIVTFCLVSLVGTWNLIVATHDGGTVNKVVNDYL